MIEPKELNPHGFPTTPEIEAHLAILLMRLNAVRKAYNEPMIVTSGLRSLELQNQLIAQGRSKASNSRHLYGQAADIYDPDAKLWSWVVQNLDLMENIGLWMEERQGPWQHFQIVPPASGNRWFLP